MSTTQQQSERRERQLAALVDISRTALSSDDLQALFDTVAVQVADVLSTEFCKILKLLPKGEDFLLVAGVGWTAGLVGDARVEVKDSQAGYTLQHRGPVVVEDLNTDERFTGPSLLRDHRIVSGMSVVIGSERRPWGAVGAHSTRQQAFSIHDAYFLQSVANILREAIEREDANRRKDEFLAVLGHELRNPLSPLVTGVDLLQRASYKPETVQKISGMMQRQLSHLVRLVDDLLNASRISRGEIELRITPLDLRSVIENAIEQTGPELSKMHHELTMSGPEHRLPIEGDPARLTQVFANVLTNAARYSDPGSPITVFLGVDGRDALVRVRDHGYGIPDEDLERIFEMFTQVSQHRILLGGGGLGIGLALARRLLKLHGGSIKASSEGEGRGSEFTIRLPLSEGVGLNEAATEPEPTRILVVDDNIDAADTLCMLLEINGYAVVVAYDGASAIDAVSRFAPEIVLLDLQLPHMDGFEIARRLRQLPSGGALRLIALTGRTQDDDRLGTAEAGFDAHLTKPVELEVLVEVIAQMR